MLAGQKNGHDDFRAVCGLAIGWTIGGVGGGRVPLHSLLHAHSRLTPLR